MACRRRPQWRSAWQCGRSLVYGIRGQRRRSQEPKFVYSRRFPTPDYRQLLRLLPRRPESANTRLSWIRAPMRITAWRQRDLRLVQPRVLRTRVPRTDRRAAPSGSRVVGARARERRDGPRRRPLPRLRALERLRLRRAGQAGRGDALLREGRQRLRAHHLRHRAPQAKARDTRIFHQAPRLWLAKRLQHRSDAPTVVISVDQVIEGLVTRAV